MTSISAPESAFFICAYYFHEEIFNSLKDMERTQSFYEFTIRKYKVHHSVKTESKFMVLFLCTSSMVLCFCTKFHELDIW